MRKIFYLTPGCFDRGGISRYCRYQLKALYKNKDNSLKVFSLYGRKFNFGEDLPFNVLTSSEAKPSLLNKFIFINLFILKFIKDKPKVVFLCHINFLLLAPILRIIRRDIKIILNIYGLEVWSSNKFKIKFLSNFIDVIISDCDNTKKYFNNNITNKKYIKRIWDCADQNIFKPNSNKLIPFKGKYIATFGRISYSAKHKGYINLLKVFSRFKGQEHIKLIIIGDGDLKNDLEQFANKLGLKDQVIFTGYLKDEDICSVLTHARVFSLVSKSGHMAGEGIPLTPIESLACGTPILVGNTDGSIECLQDEVGKALNPDDINEIYQALNFYINLSDDEYEKLSKRCINSVDKNFSFHKFSKILNELIEEIDQ